LGFGFARFAYLNPRSCPEQTHTYQTPPPHPRPENELPNGGIPLLLNDDTRVNTQIVYHATRHRAYALRASDGQAVWGPMPTGLSDQASGLLLLSSFERGKKQKPN